MSTHNPYSPPKAELSDIRPRYSKLLHDTFAALVIMQAFGTLRYCRAYLDLARTGAAHPVGLF
jgi:hypothetical protein